MGYLEPEQPMDIDDILATDRELSEEEFTFLEQETLKVMRAVRKRVQELLPHIAAHDRHLAERMEISSNRMLWALEEGARLPSSDKIGETAALKNLTRDVRRMYVEVMGADATVPSPSAVRMPRRDRRRLTRNQRKRGPWSGPPQPADSTP